MRAIVIKQYGGPEVLALETRPDPEPQSGHVLIEVKAFGLNHAEAYFRKGVWGDVAEITGIECVGVVKADPGGRLAPGQKVVAIVAYDEPTEQVQQYAPYTLTANGATQAGG